MAMKPDDAAPPKSDSRLRHSGAFGPTEAISFREWNNILTAAPITEAQRWAHRNAIHGFLKYCKELRCPATIIVIKAYLEGIKRAAGPAPETADGLRWFYKQALRARNQGTANLPTPVSISERPARRSGPTLASHLS
jgi:hypothetical protein